MSEARGPGESRRGERQSRTTVVYDWAETPPTAAVVETFERVVGDDLDRALPLYESVEPDALDALFDHALRNGEPSSTSVCFEFAGHLVTVYGSGELVLKPLADHA